MPSTGPASASAATTAPEPLAEARAALARHDWDGCLALLDAVDASPEQEPQRLDLAAEASWWLGRLDDCIALRRRAYQAYEAAGDLRSAGRCAVWLYENHCQRAQPAIASAWLQRARRALGDDVECPEHGVLLLREVEVAHGSGRLAEAVDIATQALALGRRLGSSDLEAEALQAMGRVLVDAGDVQRGLAHLDEAMLLAVEGRLGPYSTGKVYCSLVGACEDVGDLRRAAEWTEATVEWAASHPLAVFPGICRMHRAVVLDRRGELRDAEREADRACAELAGSHVANAAAAYAEVGDIRRRLGDLDGAEAAFARAEELTGRPSAGVALLRLAQGRVEAAARVIADHLAGVPANRLARARLLPAAVQIAIAADDLDAAAEHADELAGTAADFDIPLLHAMAAQAQGRLLLARGEPRPACTVLREALQQWHDLDVPYEVATTRTVLAQALREAGDEEAAAASFAAAGALFDRLGARAAELDGLEATASDGRRDHGYPDGLTAREVEVLRLLAAGASNKDVAASLHLSVKTVSRHLSNIFTKIGVSSRAAATAYAFEHRLVGH